MISLVKQEHLTLTGTRRKLGYPHGHFNCLVQNSLVTLLGFLSPQVHTHSNTWCQVCNKNEPIVTFCLIMQNAKELEQYAT
jgi:hypothetical protein